MTFAATFATRILRRLGREDGLAALVAIGVTLALGVASAGSLVYTTQNYGSSSRSKVDQFAYTLAEAGINNALAVLSKSTNDPTNPALLPERTTEYEGGTVRWGGTYNAELKVWTLRSTGAYRNPTGPTAAAVERTVTAKVPVESSPTSPLGNQLWNYWVATRTGAACDQSLASDVALSGRLYALGNLCFSSGAHMTDGALAVGGRLEMSSTNNYVGTSAAPVAEVHVRGGCKYGRQHAHPDASHPSHAFCSSADNVYGATVDQSPPAYTPPTVEWDRWYAEAAPGPRNPCTTSSGAVPAFDNDATRNNSLTANSLLTPSGSYSCVVGPADAPRGELSWDATSRVLTVRGTVFVDGSVTAANAGVIRYTGQGVLYVSGSFIVGGSTKICAVVAGSDCDFNYGAWDPNKVLFGVIAGGNGNGGASAGASVDINSYARFQGAMYGAWNIQFGTGSRAHGPLIAWTFITCSSMTIPPFPLLSSSPVGLPGNGSGHKIGRPTSFSG